MLNLERFRDQLAELIDWLETNAGDLPSLPDVSDADMAIMYLRHLQKHLGVADREG